VTEEIQSTEPTELVEHFFRHESARLVAVLTRAFGFTRIGLVEDKVQEAMVTALRSWRQRGIPKNPAGWIHRVARNGVVDALRREKVHDRAVSLALQSTSTPQIGTDQLVEEWLTEEKLPDSLLRMMFVCCHPSLDRRSQIALTLKILCGFSVSEVARGLLISPEAAKKRIQRAKAALAERKVRVDLPAADALGQRIDVVLDVLYLTFNEGYSPSVGVDPLRYDICEEAARLCHLLCEHETLSTPRAQALLALMLFHASRLEARVDDEGVTVLLEDQDRTAWDRKLMRVAERWLVRSQEGHTRGGGPTRFHIEAFIARTHCFAPSVAETNWSLIVRLYDRLIAIHRSPIYVLNRAIALGETGDVRTALAELEQIRGERAMRNYVLLDCAVGRLHELAGHFEEAADALRSAREATAAPHARALLDKKLASLESLSS